MSKIALSIYLQPDSFCVGFVDEEGHCLGSKTQHSTPSVEGIAAACNNLQASLKVDSFQVIGLVGDGLENTEELLRGLEEYYQQSIELQRPGQALVAYEQKWGYTIDENDFVALAIHSSIDGGLMINGNQATGSEGLAANMAHLLVHEQGQSLPLGNYFSKKGMVKVALNVMAETALASPLRSIAPNELTYEAITKAIANEDALALQVVRKLGQVLGLKLSDVMNYFSPKYVVLSTLATSYTNLLAKEAIPTMESALLAIFKGKAKVIASKSQGEHSLALQASAAAF